MKKLILSTAILSSVVVFGRAQSTGELLKISQHDFGNITARSAAMNGAFTSLGADISSMSINPAGLGMYKSSDFAISLGSNTATNHSNYGGANNTSFSRTRATMPSLGWAFNHKNFTAGITVNRLANFNQTASITGNSETFNSITRQWSDQLSGYKESELSFRSTDRLLWNAILGYETYTLDPSSSGTSYGTWGIITPDTDIRSRINLQTKGWVNEYALSMAGNIDDFLYLGATIGFQDILYQQESYYSESNTNGIGSFSNMTLGEYFSVSGFGVNLKLGATIRPTDWLRIGISYHTPTWIDAWDNSSASLDSRVDGTTEGYESLILEYGYEMRTPNRLLTGISATVFNRLIIAADIEFVWYGDMKYTSDIDLFDWRNGVLPNDIDNLPNTSNYINDFGAVDLSGLIKNSYSATQSYKLGLEYNAGGGLFIRGGVGYTTSPYKKLVSFYDPSQTLNNFGAVMRYSGGIGYRTGRLNLDLAYTYTSYSMLSSTFFDYITNYSYDTVVDGVIPSGESLISWENINQTQRYHNVILTLGWRF